jgi:PBP1b-binding outer membrane lipoprotein LpoB
MKKIFAFSAILISALLLGGCFNGSNNGGDARPDPTVEFSTFVKAEIANTDDTREPANINDQEFSFNDQNNEQAFDELFIQ